jgi:hypothetical protein
MLLRRMSSSLALLVAVLTMAGLTRPSAPAAAT